MSKSRKGGLGKGLEALFVDNNTDDIAPSVLKITEIEPNREQPRKDFDDSSLSELADSIREHGVLQPLLVRPIQGGMYQIVAGERRWRASRMAGLSQLPVVIKELTDSETMELALIENLQREDLNIIEEALGYKQLMEKHGYTQEQVAKRVGKSRPAVANALRMLSLPPAVEELVRSGKITPGHGRALLGLADEQTITEVAQQIVKDGLSVREVEKLSAKRYSSAKRDQTQQKQPTSWGDSYFKEMELALGEKLSRRVRVQGDKKGRGSMTIEFYSKEELAELAQKLGR